MKRVLITGGLGYLGGRICRAFSEAGWFVRVTTRRAISAAPKWAASCDVVELDANNEADLRRACAGCNLLVHLAAANEVDSARDPKSALRVNGQEGLAWLLAAEAEGIKRIVYFSTAHVYRAPLVGRFDEQTLPNPRHPYAITHRVMEDFVLAAHASRRMEGVVLRLSNAIGAPVDPNINRWTLVANDLCRQAVVNGSLTLKSSGLQLRDFIALADVTRAVLHFSELSRGKLQDGLYNLGSGHSTSVYDLAGLIATRASLILGRDITIERAAPSVMEGTQMLELCVDKLLATGFRFCSSLTEEIDSTIMLCQTAFAPSLLH